MKFLCVPCDVPMKLLETHPPDRGSISLIYSCPACGYEFAMMTNPFETQIVGSMGVKVGTDSEEATAKSSGGGCPFSGVVREMTPETTEEGDEMLWTPEAQARLATLPTFVRPMAKTGIEKYAGERGFDRVDGRVLDEAKDFFGM